MTKNKNKLPASFAIVMMSLLLVYSGCTKDTTVFVETKPVAVTRPVSFAKDIVRFSIPAAT